MTRKPTTDPSKLVKEVTKEHGIYANDRLPPSFKWGKENEFEAVKRHSCERAVCEIINTGLIVNPKYPWLGCSPDGTVLSKKRNVEGCI
eukprot:gene8563-9479_t